MKALHALLAFNRGLVSKLGLARIDLKRTGLSAETQTNWMPRVLGSMMLRPGLEYIGSTKDNAAATFLPFVFSTGDHTLIELTDQAMRVWVDHVPITRPRTDATITNGEFTSDLTGWTDNDESGAVSSWVTGGYLGLLGTGTNAAIRDQQVTVTATNTEHGIGIHVVGESVTIRVGMTQGGDDYLSDRVLREGYHSIAVTPAGDFHIRLSNSGKYTALVDSVAIEDASEMEIVTPWPEAALQDIREAQSGDVLFVACKNYQQYRIERQTPRSWSVVKYQVNDGPFKIQNTTPSRITPSGLSGDITLTADHDIFKATNVGGLYELESNGQEVEAAITAQDTWSDPIRVTGVGSSQRRFSIIRSGTWSATVTLQKSVGEPGDWSDVKTYTTNGTDNYFDDLDNQIIYYRVGVATGDYTSGTVALEVSYTAGSITGVVRITGYSDAQNVDATVLTALGGTDSTDNWAEGEWSDRRGWPTSVAFHDGRLCWAGKDRIWMSVSDAFNSFDDSTEGDSGPISRSIGSGPVDVINWIVPTTHLLIGAEGAELVARSSSLDEPLTPTNFGLKPVETLGSTNMKAVKVGTSAVFVQRNGSRVYELSFDGSSYNYAANDLTSIVPEIGFPSFSRIAVQRQPDTRIHCVRSDGKAAVLIFDKVENVTCWVLVETDGVIEDAVVIPGTEEDEVYYVVKRTIDGSTKRYLEEWALESECQGGLANKCADSFYHYSGTPTGTFTGLGHLEGETVVMWGDGAYLGTTSIIGGVISLHTSYSEFNVGLPYTAQFKSAKLATAVATKQNPTPLTQRKRIDHLGLVLADTHAQGIQYGTDFDNLDNLPLVEGGADVDGDTVHTEYDTDSIELNGTWDTDTRLCLQATAPKPCTVLAAIVSISSHDKM